MGVSQRESLVNAGHELLAELVRAQVHVFIKNLGWLPGDEKELVIPSETTLQALQGAFAPLAPPGLLPLLSVRKTIEEIGN